MADELEQAAMDARVTVNLFMLVCRRGWYGGFDHLTEETCRELADVLEATLDDIPDEPTGPKSFDANPIEFFSGPDGKRLIRNIIRALRAGKVNWQIGWPDCIMEFVRG